MDQLESLPLFLALPGSRLLPVVNVHRSAGPKDRMIAQAAELVRVWEEWQRLGQRLPIWFREILRAEQARPSAGSGHS